MVRPFGPRILKGNPSVLYFKPQGIPLRFLDEVTLAPDEFEAIKLYDCDNLSQISAAKEMGISQPTFARILQRAYKKIAQAIVSGKAIKIEKKMD